VKNNQYVISLLEKGEQIVDKCHYVTLAYSSECSICENADTIKESAKSRAEMFV
jgi:hypothetical protein